MTAFPRSKDILALPAALAAVSQQDTELLKSLLEDITDVDVTNELLYFCARQGSVECVKLVLAKGDNPAVWMPDEDETALSVACASGHLEIIEMFLESGCDVNARCNGDMHTALHSSSIYGHVECANLLLKYGADPNIKDCFAHTALMKACKSGCFTVATALLERGAVTTIKNIKGQNAFIIALLERHADCVRELLFARPEFCIERTPEGLLPLTHAIRSKETALVQAFVDARCDLNAIEGLLLTPIQLAIETGHIPTIKTLLKGGCDANAPQGLPTGSTPLMLAVCKGRADIVDALVQNGCDLDTFDRHGRTALYLAVKHGFLQCVHKLLKAGADPDMFDEIQSEIVGSRNALQCAVLSNRPEEALALIQSGCNLFQGTIYPDADGHGPITAFHCAVGKECRWAVRILVHADPTVIRSIDAYKGDDEEIKHVLETALQLIFKPKTLKTRCRNFIRTWLGNKRLFDKVPRLSLPLPLEDYVLFRDMEYLI